jgi:hypothetical protein
MNEGELVSALLYLFIKIDYQCVYVNAVNLCALFNVFKKGCLAANTAQAISFEGGARLGVFLHDFFDGHLFTYHRKLLWFSR